MTGITDYASQSHTIRIMVHSAKSKLMYGQTNVKTAFTLSQVGRCTLTGPIVLCNIHCGFQTVSQSDTFSRPSILCIMDSEETTQQVRKR